MTTELVRKLGSFSIIGRLAVLALVLILPACSSGNASITVTWTIASRSDASLCTQYGASSVVIRVVNASGNEFTRVTPACSAMSTTIPNVPAGTYWLWAQMTDALGNSVSSAVGPIAVTVTGGGPATQNFDFPTTAFVNSGVGSLSTLGTLEVDWTIVSSSAAPQCSSYGAANIAINLFDANGNPYGATTTAACSAQTTSVYDLTPGTYSLAVKMLDANGQAVSTTASANGVTIAAGVTTQQSFDFPVSSFLGNTNATTGVLEIDWTVASSTNASLCSAHNAANIAVQVYDISNLPYGSVQMAPCSSFVLSIPSLPPGSYSVDGQLVDAAGQPVSTRIPPQPVTIVAGTTTPEQFDFPTISFTN